MTPRQRYREALLFGSPDKVPFTPGGPRETTLARWRQEGLPEGIGWYDYLLEVLGIEEEQTQPRVNLGVSFQMIPKFEEKILEHKNGHYLVRDWMGAITEISDEYNYTYIRSAKDFVTRRWWRFPVTNRDEWEQMKSRFDPHDRRRFPRDFDERCAKLQDRDYVSGLYINGPFWQLREWVGFEALCVLMIEDPDFVHQMIEFWTEFISATLAPIIQRVQFDSVGFSEDMAYKQHSMISPAMCREFLMPCWTRWTQELKASGCPVVYLDSDGYAGELIPLWIECGINAEGPNEIAAGNDLVEFRRLYGKQMAYDGGIDKRAMAKGGPALREAIMNVVPPLLEEGGYIPGCDHGIPANVSWPNYVEYARLLAQLTGWL